MLSMSADASTTRAKTNSFFFLHICKKSCTFAAKLYNYVQTN